jgi:hypothetical protein
MGYSGNEAGSGYRLMIRTAVLLVPPTMNRVYDHRGAPGVTSVTLAGADTRPGATTLYQSRDPGALLVRARRLLLA